MRLDSLSRLLPLFCLLALPLLVFSFPVWAEENTLVAPSSSPAPRAGVTASAPAQSLPPQAMLDRNEVTILRDNYAGKYKDATLANLSQLYWRLGAFDLSDDLAIGNYIKINDCRVFTDFVNDDMEWAQIVDVMRDHIEKNRDTFPVNFQFMLQLHLGRYDPARGGFDIVNRTGFVDTKRIEVDSMDSNLEVCFDRRGVPEYPTRIVILLPQSFTLDFIKMDEHVAQAYILRKQSEYSQLDESRRINRYERDAYVRLRVSFSQYNGNMMQGSSRRLASILYGQIDGYEVFEDAAQKRLMVSVDFNDETAALMTLPLTEPAAGDVAGGEALVSPAMTTASSYATYATPQQWPAAAASASSSAITSTLSSAQTPRAAPAPQGQNAHAVSYSFAP